MMFMLKQNQFNQLFLNKKISLTVCTIRLEVLAVELKMYPLIALLFLNSICICKSGSNVIYDAEKMNLKDI